MNFNFDVRPILVRNCYLCHGPDPSSRKADLRLDTYEGATASKDDGIHPIVPGKPRKSELVRRINHSDPEVVMPPPETNMKLTDYEIAVLERWIDQGAEWTDHWSFIPPEGNPGLNSKESTNLIDYFIDQKIDEKGLTSAPVAEPNKLLRRVSYMLTGLPPDQDMIANYLSDQSPDAYERMVDHYLDSDAFGERWARHWMDVVRYAETKGHEFDYTTLGAWHYRDYLIRAFNDDIPYDQLVKEHLAGDLITHPRRNGQTRTNESQVGTMFYVFSEGKHSPVDTKKEEADRIDNIIDVASKTFQGLTVSCARCHDHKFDPIPTADYYSMYGVMQSSRFSPVPANVSLEKERSVEIIDSLKSSIRTMLSKKWSVAASKEAKRMEKSSETKEQIDYKMIGDFRGRNLDGWLSNGLAFGDKTTLGDPVFDRSKKYIVGLSDGKASSRSYATGLFGAIRSPNFVIDKDFIGVMAQGRKSVIRIIIDNFQLIQNPIYGELEKKINHESMQQVVFDLSAWKGHTAYIEIMPGEFKSHVYTLTEDAFVEVAYVIAYDESWPEKIEFEEEQMHRSPDLLDGWRSGQSSPYDVNRLNDLIQGKKLNTTSMDIAANLRHISRLSEALKDTAFYEGIYEGFGRDSHVFNRGNTDDLSAETVPRGFLSVLSHEETKSVHKGSGRLEFAEAVLDPENPLTSRVMVNRIWHHMFGRGIVETVDNFGLQGKLPSHPELLDQLAIKFINDNWSIKKMVKYIMMSKTFQRSTEDMPNSQSLDPDNILLSHYPVRRLEAEAIHDALLAVAGNLNPQMYGPPVPLYLTSFMQGRGRPGESGPLDGNGRRSIYHEVRRNFLEPMMLTFDRPIPFTTFGNRNVTNVPAQSLILMNSEFVSNQAAIMAEEIISHRHEDEAAIIKHIYIKALTREPTDLELEAALGYIKLLAHSYELNDAEICESVEVWKDYCHSVFNLKEFIYLV